jgi:hypothetical protein
MKRTTRQVSHRGAYSDDLCSGFVSEESSTHSMNPAFVIIVKVSNLRVISFCERSEQHESVCVRTSIPTHTKTTTDESSNSGARTIDTAPAYPHTQN